MTAVTLPADGATVWCITGPGRASRWLRLRKDGAGYPLPDGWVATRCPYGQPALDGKPDELRWLWRMVEAAPAWGWRLRPVLAGGITAGWELLIENPYGTETCFTWLGTRLITARETVTDVTGQLTGPVLSEATCLLDPRTTRTTLTEGAP